VVRVQSGGHIEVLDLAGEDDATMEALRKQLETSVVLIEPSILGRSFRFQFVADRAKT
jgi:hypothetical protein